MLAPFSRLFQNHPSVSKLVLYELFNTITGFLRSKTSLSANLCSSLACGSFVSASENEDDSVDTFGTFNMGQYYWQLLRPLQ